MTQREDGLTQGRAASCGVPSFGSDEAGDQAGGRRGTEREVWIRDTGTKHDQGHPIYEYRNYIDYFHSLLHISPDHRHFPSNGWVWSPVDVVLAFSTQAFLDEWEPTGARIPGSGYNWDRPCTFTGNNTFVLALDDRGAQDFPDDDDRSADGYKQLAFFTIPDLPSTDGIGLDPTTLVSCDVFPRNAHGEVKGELHHDPVSGCLVAMTESGGAFLLTPTGQKQGAPTRSQP